VLQDADGNLTWHTILTVATKLEEGILQFTGSHVKTESGLQDGHCRPPDSWTIE